MLLEIFAVIFAITYLILAVRQNILCWYAAFLSTSIYIYLYWDVSLYMESILNIYYLLMAIYGWINWSNRKEKLLLEFSASNYNTPHRGCDEHKDCRNYL